MTSPVRYSARVDPPWSLLAWRKLARHALLAQVAPASIDWIAGAQQTLLPAEELSGAPARTDSIKVTQEFLDLAAAVLCHRDPARHGLLYQILWRVREHGSRLLGRATDPQIHAARLLQKAVHRDCHKMKAFVRFRQLGGSENDFVSWFEPQSDIVDRVAPFFQRRFTGMNWSILTPYRSVAWDGRQLRFGQGARRGDAPAEDANERLWRTYYRHIFNPARVNPKMMQQEMPRQYWKNLPEAGLIPELLNQSVAAVDEMIERAPQLPRRRIPNRRK